jgi:hypothetical protein
MLDEETSVTDRARGDDLLQATGVELGNSIFNATGTMECIVLVQDVPALLSYSRALRDSV